MPMTPEEKRRRERERKARYRAQQRAKPRLEALPQIGRASGVPSGTEGGTQPDEITNLSAAREVIESIEVPKVQRFRVALILQLARDLDTPQAIPQRASLAARYTENIDALIAAAKPRERDELDELRRAFYSGGVSGIDDDPEASQRRAVRKKA